MVRTSNAGIKPPNPNQVRVFFSSGYCVIFTDGYNYLTDVTGNGNGNLCVVLVGGI